MKTFTTKVISNLKRHIRVYTNLFIGSSQFNPTLEQQRAKRSRVQGERFEREMSAGNSKSEREHKSVLNGKRPREVLSQRKLAAIAAAINKSGSISKDKRHK